MGTHEEQRASGMGFAKRSSVKSILTGGKFMMKHLFAVALIWSVVLYAGTAEACTASNTMAQAQNNIDSHEFHIAKTVIIEELVDEFNWENLASVYSGIGVMMFEDIAPYDNLQTVEDATAFLDDPARIHQGATYNVAGTSIQVLKVKDHVHFHGQEWETGVQHNGQPVDDHWEADILVGEDHAG
jgi:hypothetical protein